MPDMTHPNTIPEHAEAILKAACLNPRDVEAGNWNDVLAAVQAVHDAGARNAKKVADEREAELHGQLMRMVDRWEAQQKMMERLRADLAKYAVDVHTTCESCMAPLFEHDDYVSNEDVSGCWAEMTDLPSKRARPCYAYRVGKPDASNAIDPAKLGEV